MGAIEIQITQDIKNYIDRGGGYYSGWYVGIAADPRSRLFNDHAVQEQGDSWIFRTATTSEGARAVEQYLLGLGIDGGPGGGDDSSRAVYAYKKSYHTSP